MTASRPILCVFDGEAFRPANPYQARIATDQYGEGEIIPLIRHEQRSEASHNHEFAWLRDCWLSLPEQYAMEPWAQSPKHLRKYALVRTGYCTTDTIAAGNNAAALRMAAFIRGREEYTLVSVEGSTVRVFTPESQAKAAMGKARFQESKTAIMDFIAGLIGVDPASIPREQSA